MDGLMKRERFVVQINYHSFGQLLLYPFGWQVETPTDRRPAVPGAVGRRRGDKRRPSRTFDPDLGAELYTTNGETTDHAYAQYGTLAWTPESRTRRGERRRRRFVFQDNEADMQAEFEKNLPFALDVAKSADDPADPSLALGNMTPDFQVDPFAVSYGDPQTVQVDAKRKLGPVTLHYRVNGGRRSSRRRASGRAASATATTATSTTTGCAAR